MEMEKEQDWNEAVRLKLKARKETSPRQREMEDRAGWWSAYLYLGPRLPAAQRGVSKEGAGTDLRSCLRRAVISSPRRAEPSSAVSTLRCSLAFSPARRRLLSSRSSRLLSSSAVAGLRTGTARASHQPAAPTPTAS